MAIISYWYAMQYDPRILRENLNEYRNVVANFIEDKNYTIPTKWKGVEKLTHEDSFEYIKKATFLVSKIRNSFYSYHLSYIIFNISKQLNLSIEIATEKYLKKAEELCEDNNKPDTESKRISFWRGQKSTEFIKNAVENIAKA